MDQLPEGFPLQLKGLMAWRGEDYAGKPELYVDDLLPDDIDEINEAIAHFKGLGLPRGFMSRETFPLSAALSERLGRINDTLNNGRGFQVVRGIEPSKYTEDEHIILFIGISAHVASDRAGHVDHIRHEKKDESRGEHLRPTELPVSMDFHTDADAGNILALFVEAMAASGGEQYLSSVWQVYNVLARDVLADLARDWYWEKPNVELGGRAYQSFYRAVVGHVDGKVEVNFGRSFVAGHPKYPLAPDAPGLTEQQEASLCAFMEVARKHSFRLETRVGDLLYVNNLSILHARGAFRDSADSDTGRHLMRLWMRDDKTSWPFAASLKYQSQNHWGVRPEAQRLCTVSEWEAIPRPIRIKVTGTGTSHD